MERSLKSIRERLYPSVLALARKAGVSHTTINRYEDGSSEPSLTKAMRHAELLGITVTEYAQLWTAANNEAGEGAQ